MLLKEKKIIYTTRVVSKKKKCIEGLLLLQQHFSYMTVRFTVAGKSENFMADCTSSVCLDYLI